MAPPMGKFVAHNKADEDAELKISADIVLIREKYTVTHKM
jgi:hypothetical protein